jgi:hypothetical protein
MEQNHNQSIPVTLTYKLTGSGWSECQIEIGKENALITASYLSDALGSLVRAAVDLLTGSTEAIAQFDEEPGEYRWLFSQRNNELQLRILWFNELWGNRPNEEGEPILVAQCSLMAFARALHAALEHILEEHGIEGYKDMWVEHDFPLQSYEALKSLI